MYRRGYMSYRASHNCLSVRVAAVIRPSANTPVQESHRKL